MKDMLGIGLVAVGGYLLYEWFFAPQVVAATVPTTSNTTANQNTSDNQIINPSGAGSNSNPVSNNNIVKSQLVSAAMQNQQFDNSHPGNPMGTYWQWNYIYMQVTGVPQSAGPIGDPGMKLTVDGYMGMRGQNGLSGLGMGRVWVSGYGGMGAIGAGYGINQLRLSPDATAYEMANKRFI